ncbi:MAG: helix-turn-helix transcriptional regulator [Thiohalomonadales bacterium]
MSNGDSIHHIEPPFGSLLNHTIQEIYHLSHSSSHSQFKQLAVNSMGNLIDNCDVYWLTVADLNNKKLRQVISHSCYLCQSQLKTHSQLSSQHSAQAITKNGPPSTNKNSETAPLDVDSLLAALPDWQDGISFIVSPDVLKQTSNKQGLDYDSQNNEAHNDARNNNDTGNHSYNNVARIQANIDSNSIYLVTVMLDLDSQLFDVFVVQHINKNQNFSNDENMITQYLVPHIVEAYGINLLHNRLLNDFSTSTAVCDMQGHLLLADERFKISLSNLHADSKGMVIPEDVFHSLLDNIPVIYGRNRIILKARIIDKLVYCEFLEERRCAGLTNRERLVTKYMIQGLNHLEMAKQLDTPVSKVLYTVNCIFKKLGIKNKAELNLRFASKQPNLQLQTFCCPVNT